MIIGDEMAEGLFTQSFSIGHRYPNPSSLWSSSSSSSSLPQFNTSAPSSFPGRGIYVFDSSFDTFCQDSCNSNACIITLGGFISRLTGNSHFLGRCMALFMPIYNVQLEFLGVSLSCSIYALYICHTTIKVSTA